MPMSIQGTEQRDHMWSHCPYGNRLPSSQPERLPRPQNDLRCGEQKKYCIGAQRQQLSHRTAARMQREGKGQQPYPMASLPRSCGEQDKGAGHGALTLGKGTILGFEEDSKLDCPLHQLDIP